MTLTDFLLARIAEDEAEIGPLFGRDEKAGPNGIGWAEVGAISEVLMSGQARALAECEAKRRIVDYRERVAGESAATGVPLFEAQLSAYDAALRALALPYADHPDYRNEWKP